MNTPITFGELIIGTSNRFAHAAVTAIANHPGNMYNPLWLYGPSGTGKTTLLQTALRQIQEHRPELRVLCLQAEEYAQKLISAMQTETQAEFRAWLSNTDVLAVDHAEYLLGRNHTQLSLARELVHLSDRGCQVVLVSACPAPALEELHQRLRYCCEWFLQVDIMTPTDEERLAMVQQTAPQLDLPLSEPMIHRIVQSSRTHCHVRSILNQLAARRHFLGPDAGDLSEMLDALLKNEVAV